MMTTFFVVAFMLIFCCDISESSPAVGVVGGEVNINITISDRSLRGMSEVKDQNGQSLLQFYSGNAGYTDPDVKYTGNISGGFVSFNLSKLTIQRAGIYQYIISNPPNVTIAGEQYLVIAGNPNRPVITALFQLAEAGREYKLNCSAASTSEKPGHNLTMFSEWKKNGADITSDGSKFDVNETILTIRNLSKTDYNVSLTCIAFEDQRVKSPESTAFPFIFYYCVPSCQYRWTGPGGNYSDKTGKLSISKIRRHQSGVFTCTATNPNLTSNSATATVLVTVQYGPENITLSPSQMSYDLVENSSLNVNCSADCVPSCQYRWTGPGVNYSDKTGILFISKISRSQTGVFTCAVSNPNITSNSASTMSVKVTVQYGPDSIKLSPNQTSYENLENSSLNVNCSADCVPNCQYRWTGPGGNYTDKTGILLISKICRSQTGVFTCTASNPNITSNLVTATLSVAVQYGPDNIKLSTSQMSYEVVENSYLNINCSADCVPSCQYIWAFPGGNYPYTSGILYISKISRSQTGVYTCTASNPSITSNPATATVMVTVQYPPSIQGLKSTYQVIENETLNVTCVATSNPPANLTFWSPRGEGSVNSILYFSSVSRNKSGIYNCTAQNTMKPTDGEQQNGTTTNQTQVDVQYGARISNLSVQGGNTINENSSAIFNCHVDSNPPSTITWMKEGSSTVLQTEYGVVHSQYTIESAECLENYTCSADNGIWTTAKERLELFVRCHPRTDFRLGLETKLYRKHHEEAILRYTVIAYPPPTFTWTFLGNSKERRALPVSASQHDNGQQSELRITSLDIIDFGNYSVIANNSFVPSATVVFEIIQAVVPDIPSNVTVTDIKQTSLTVHWIAGHNGGLQQTFQIIITIGAFISNVHAPDPGYGKSGTQTIENLMANTEYSISMTANNVVGSSNVSNVIKVITLKVPDDTCTSSTSPISAVAGGVVGAIVAVILLVGISILIWRRYQHKKSVKEQMYENATHVDGSLNKENAYEGLSNTSGDNAYDTLGASNGTCVEKDSLMYVNLKMKPLTNKNGEPNIGRQNHQT